MSQEDFFNKMKEDNEDYIRNNNVGFYVQNNSIKFIKSKRTETNKNWEASLDDITGIALANVMRFDDDSLFIILIRGNKKTIHHNRTYQSEEAHNFDLFKDAIKEKFDVDIGVDASGWQEDKIVLIYPKELKGVELYKPWNSSIKSFIQRIGRLFWINHHVSGVIKDELKSKLGITK